MTLTDREPAGDRGSASAVVLGILIVISLLFAGTTIFIGSSIQGVKRQQDRAAAAGTPA